MFARPRISADATPSTVRQQPAGSRASGSPEIAEPDSSSLENPRYITAVVCPVVLVTIGSLDSFGIRYLTEFRLRENFGQRLVRIEIQLDVDLDRAPCP